MPAFPMPAFPMSAFPRNPILGTAYRAPVRHFELDALGAPTGRICEGRREAAGLAEELRREVASWRALPPNSWGVSGTTKRLLRHWRDPERREHRLFFCQLEAIETLIWIAELAPSALRARIAAADPEFGRLAVKMATGTGKTTVMAMLIAWHALNKAADPLNPLYADAFLILCPGLTIRGRLRVLQPGHRDNCYQAQDLVPADMMADLALARIRIVNFQAFKPRPHPGATGLARALLRGREAAPSQEIAVERVCAGLAGRGGIAVLNDEAHHCWRGRTAGVGARVWLDGIEAVRQRQGVRAVYDFSATPFFLRGSGYPEGTQFPWVVSDFPLVDAIESGIVKVPRRAAPDLGLPRKAAIVKDDDPFEAIGTLYAHYRQIFALWAEAGQAMPPVFVIVCGTTRVSKQIFDHVTETLPLFARDADGTPRTLLIDSAQLESGEAMGAAFRKAAAEEIQALRRFSGQELRDEDLLREAMNSVGKPGRLGAPIRCVISVAMLNEGWDTKTVTHILGLRPFASPLLCEQVVGRGLRRVSSFGVSLGGDAEYVDVAGIPFGFMADAAMAAPKLPPAPRLVAVPNREEIRFPRLQGYRAGFPAERLRAAFSEESILIGDVSYGPSPACGRGRGPARRAGRVRAGADVPMPQPFELFDRSPHPPASGPLPLPQAGEGLSDGRVFALAMRTLRRWFLDGEGQPRAHLLPDLAAITGEWLRQCLTGCLSTEALIEEAAARIAQSCVLVQSGGTHPRPVLDPAAGVGTHAGTGLIACADAAEAAFCEALAALPGSIALMKNTGTGLAIPYVAEGEPRRWLPDFILRLDDGGNGPLNLVVERGFRQSPFSAEKAAAIRDLWLPCVNADGRFGRWDFLPSFGPSCGAGRIGCFRAL